VFIQTANSDFLIKYFVFVCLFIVTMMKPGTATVAPAVFLLLVVATVVAG